MLNLFERRFGAVLAPVLTVVACNGGAPGQGDSGVDAGIQRGHVDVFAYLAEEPGQVPATGALVAFQDLDGASRSTYVDAQGHAAGEVQAGGTVWLARFTAQQFGSNLIAAYRDVQPGSTLVFGPPQAPSHATVGSITVAGDPSTSFTYVQVYATCGGRSPTDRRILVFDDRCTSTVDILAVAYQHLAVLDVLVSYAFLPAQPAVDGSTVTIPSGAWKAPDAVSVHFTNSDGATIPGVGVANEFGVLAQASPSGTDTFTAQLPLVGTSLVVTTTPSRALSGQAAEQQEIIVIRPAAASNDIDLHGVSAPWISQPQTSLQPWPWSEDDVGGALHADAMITTYRWDQPIANYQENNLLRVISPVQPPSAIPFPELPDALSTEQPGQNFQINTHVQLLRLHDATSVDPLRLAEQLTRNAPGTIRLEEATQSLALTQ